MPRYRVVVTDLGYPTYEYEEEQIRAIDGELVLTDCSTEDELITALRDADGVLARAAPVTAKVIESLERCRVIARYGVGVDNIDIEAATRKGVFVANVPDYCWDDVSDHALALLLSCARRIVSHDKQVREGAWDIGAKDPIFRMRGKTLGLIGFGNIAQTLAQKVQGFGLRIITADPFVSAEAAKEKGVELVALDELLSQSDYVSIHAPLNDGTHHLIGEEQFRKMKPTAILVNTSRGPIVDEAALCRALEERWLDGAGIDVYENEPPGADNPLMKLDNVVLTDHAGWYSEEAQVELQTKAAAEVVRVLKGGVPKSCLNPEAKRNA